MRFGRFAGIVATVAGAASFIGLSACSGSLLQSKISPQISYVLAAQGAAAKVGEFAPLPVDLGILKPRLAPGFDTDRILLRYPDRRLDYFAGAHWTGTLDDIVQDLAVQIFRLRGELRGVNAESSRFTNQYVLEIEVQDFQAEYEAAGSAPSVRVRLNARLGSAADHRSLGHFEATALQPAAGNRLGVIVAAYERAANEALGQIGAQTAAMLRGLPKQD